MDKTPLEEQMKVLQTHFGRIVSTIKHLKTSVDNLGEKLEAKSQMNEIQDILKPKVWLRRW